MEPIRVALIGKTGAGKSAVGNTLLGSDVFESDDSAESITIECVQHEGIMASGRPIRVVDTPGIMDTAGRDVRDEVTKAIAYLSPGPHAFLIVLQPGRATEEEKRAIRELQDLFGDEGFLAHTILVMTRKKDIIEKNKPFDICKYIDTKCHQEVKDIFKRCGGRIVAVENKHSTEKEKEEYAKEIVDKVIKMGGYYSHDYFKLLQEKKIQAIETAKLRREMEKIAKEKNYKFCSIL